MYLFIYWNIYRCVHAGAHIVGEEGVSALWHGHQCNFPRFLVPQFRAWLKFQIIWNIGSHWFLYRSSEVLLC